MRSSGNARPAGRWPQSKAELVQNCRDVRQYVEGRGLATTAEIDECWPKSKRAKVWDWIHCARQLTRFLERELDGREAPQWADREAVAALADEPVEVRLTEPLNGSDTLFVCPKNYPTLEWFRERDMLLGRIARTREAIRDAMESGKDIGVRQPTETLDQLIAEEGYQLALMAAQACQEGVHLVRDVDPSPFEALGTTDLIRIHGAFMKANARRLLASRLLASVQTTRPGHALRWAVVFATLADRQGISSASLIRDRSLVSIIATAELSLEGRVPERDTPAPEN